MQTQNLMTIWFPFNWFPQRVGTSEVSQDANFPDIVSIQLVSPASGDDGKVIWAYSNCTQGLFPFNWFPQRVGTLSYVVLCFLALRVSIQLVSPASGDFFSSRDLCFFWCVSIQLVSPASGDNRPKLPDLLC